MKTRMLKKLSRREKYCFNNMTPTLIHFSLDAGQVRFDLPASHLGGQIRDGTNHSQTASGTYGTIGGDLFLW